MHTQLANSTAVYVHMEHISVGDVKQERGVEKLRCHAWPGMFYDVHLHEPQPAAFTHPFRAHTRLAAAHSHLTTGL